MLEFLPRLFYLIWLLELAWPKIANISKISEDPMFASLLREDKLNLKALDMVLSLFAVNLFIDII